MGGEGVSEVGLGKEGGREGGREWEDEPKGRWIWTPLTRSFLVYRGIGMLGDGCREDAEMGRVVV